MLVLPALVLPALVVLTLLTTASLDRDDSRGIGIVLAAIVAILLTLLTVNLLARVRRPGRDRDRRAER